ALLSVLMLACAAGLWRSRPIVTAPVAPGSVAPVPNARRARWVLLSFAPSSLMLGVTTYFSSEVAVVPLLWIVPLLLYLVTFIIAFGRPTADLAWIRRGFPMLFVALLL